MKPRRGLRLIILLLALPLVGCHPAWDVTLPGPAGEAIINRETLKALADFAVQVDGEPAIPLERVFVVQGYQMIDEIVIEDEDGREHRSWHALCE